MCIGDYAHFVTNITRINNAHHSLMHTCALIASCAFMNMDTLALMQITNAHNSLMHTCALIA